MFSAGRVAVAGGGELDWAFTACMVNRRTLGNSSASVLSWRCIDLPPFVRSMQRFVVPKRSLTLTLAMLLHVNDSGLVVVDAAAATGPTNRSLARPACPHLKKGHRTCC